jgi:putative transposase
VLTISERRACRALGQYRSTQRKVPRGRDDEAALLADLVELARRYGRYGYRKIAALLRAAGWLVNDKRVERLWRQEGLKVPARQPRKGRLWDGMAPVSGCGPSTAIIEPVDPLVV